MTAVRGGGGTRDDSKMRPLAVSFAASGRTTAVRGGSGTGDDSKMRPLAVSIVLQSSLRTAPSASSSDCRSIASLSLPIAAAIGAATTFFSVLVFAGSSTASTPQPASQPSSVGTGNDTAGEATSLHSFTVFGAQRSSLGTAAAVQVFATCSAGAAEGADVAATSAAASDAESGKASITRPRSARIVRGSCQREEREVVGETWSGVCASGGGEGGRAVDPGRAAVGRAQVALERGAPVFRDAGTTQLPRSRRPSQREATRQLHAAKRPAHRGSWRRCSALYLP